MRNFWLASDIIITKDSEGFFSADHKYQGDLIIDGNHSIEAAITSRFAGAGSIPVLGCADSNN